MLKNSAGIIPKGIRRTNRLFRKKNFKRGEQLLSIIREIAEDHQVTMAQIALNWVTRSPNVIAIPGAKNLAQFEANVGSTEFELTQEEIDRIKKALKDFHPKLFL